MKVKRFIDHETKTHTYIVSKNNLSIIIDPVYFDVENYLEYLHSINSNLACAFDTHMHADHITGTGLLRKKTNCKIGMHEKSSVNNIDLKLSDGQVITFGELNIQVIYTPGHTLESCCYLIDNMLFTGDTLLINSCGRTDFQNGSSAELYNSIFKKILTLHDETIIYPGHDYNNRMISNIAQERANNPRLQVETLLEFANIMDNLNLPVPKFIDIALPRNVNCGIA